MIKNKISGGEITPSVEETYIITDGEDNSSFPDSWRGTGGAHHLVRFARSIGCSLSVKFVGIDLPDMRSTEEGQKLGALFREDGGECVFAETQRGDDAVQAAVKTIVDPEPLARLESNLKQCQRAIKAHQTQIEALQIKLNVVIFCGITTHASQHLSKSKSVVAVVSLITLYQLGMWDFKNGLNHHIIKSRLFDGMNLIKKNPKITAVALIPPGIYVAFIAIRGTVRIIFTSVKRVGNGTMAFVKVIFNGAITATETITNGASLTFDNINEMQMIKTQSKPAELMLVFGMGLLITSLFNRRR